MWDTDQIETLFDSLMQDYPIGDILWMHTRNAKRRTPPEYIPRLIAYPLKYEELMKGREEDLL